MINHQRELNVVLQKTVHLFQGIKQKKKDELFSLA